MNVLVTGAAGQVGTALVHQLTARGDHAIAVDLPEVDICDMASVSAVFAAHHPDVVINCAAYNDVNGAEKNPQAAMAVNRDAVRNLAKVAGKACFVVHYGTDYVFDGTKGEPYVESDATNPQSIYGKSKLEGEHVLLDAGGNFLLLRLSSVFGAGTQSFFYRIREQLLAGKPLRVVTDQVSSLTYAEDAASVTLAALDANLRGLYHVVNRGAASRHAAAVEFVAAIGADVDVGTAHSSDFASVAPRPMCSVLDTAKIESDLGMTMPTWQDAVHRYSRTLE